MIALDKRLPFILEILLLAFSSSIPIVWLYIELRPPAVQFSLSPSEIRPDSGHAYITRLPRTGFRHFLTVETDSDRAPDASLLELYEDGHRLGPGHLLPDDVRNLGKGAFSHRGREFFFSTSDGSSPLTNRRSYLVTVYLTPNSFLRLLGLVALLLALWRITCLLPPAPAAILNVIRRILRWFATPGQLGGHWIVSVIAGFAVIGASWYYLSNLWASARTIGFAVGGFFQVSDASGYAMCANRVLDQGVRGVSVVEYFGGWCLRRPIYPTFLASILAMTGRSWLWTLLLQSALVGLAIIVLLRATSRLAGLASALVVLWLMFSFAANNAFPDTTTESAGLALGAPGLALLLDAARVRNRRILFLGAACFSVALNARAGAFFVLPFLLAAMFFQARPWHDRMFSTAIAFAGIAVGFVAQIFLIHYFGGAASASHSNFSYTLYGLSVGGKGWGQIFTDHPEILRNSRSDAEAAQMIFRLAWQNMLSSPSIMAKALTRNLLQYARDPLSGTTRSWLFPVGLWWLGGVAIASRWRELPYRVIGLMSLGVFLSSSVLIQDGGPRVFAATWGLTALQVGLGLHLLLTWLWKAVDRSYSSAALTSPPIGKFDVAVAVFLLVLILLPLTPIRSLASLQSVSPQGCANGEKELIARLGRESYIIVLADESQPKNKWRMQVSPYQLRNGLRGAWFEKGFAELSVPSTVIHGYQIRAGIGEFPFASDVRLVWSGDLGKFVGRTVSLCFRPDVTVPVTDETYYQTSTVRALDR